MSGKKKKLYSKDVRQVHVPAYENLTIQHIADEVGKYNTVGHYLPDNPKEVQKMPKQYIANICATLLGTVFTDWIRVQVEERNKSLLVDKGNVVNMDPEIAAVFKASTKISCKYSLILFILPSVLLLEQNGVGYHMLKAGSKKRRTKAQVQQDKLDDLDR